MKMELKKLADKNGFISAEILCQSGVRLAYSKTGIGGNKILDELDFGSGCGRVYSYGELSDAEFYKHDSGGKTLAQSVADDRLNELKKLFNEYKSQMTLANANIDNIKSLISGNADSDSVATEGENDDSPNSLFGGDFDRFGIQKTKKMLEIENEFFRLTGSEFSLENMQNLIASYENGLGIGLARGGDLLVSDAVKSGFKGLDDELQNRRKVSLQELGATASES